MKLIVMHSGDGETFTIFGNIQSKELDSIMKGVDKYSHALVECDIEVKPKTIYTDFYTGHSHSIEDLIRSNTGMSTSSYKDKQEVINVK